MEDATEEIDLNYLAGRLSTATHDIAWLHDLTLDLGVGPVEQLKPLVTLLSEIQQKLQNIANSLIPSKQDTSQARYAIKYMLNELETLRDAKYLYVTHVQIGHLRRVALFGTPAIVELQSLIANP